MHFIMSFSSFFFFLALLLLLFRHLSWGFMAFWMGFFFLSPPAKKNKIPGRLRWIMDDDDDDGFGVKEEEEEEEIKKKYWKLEGFPSIMNLRIFFLLHIDPSYTCRIMPPFLHLPLPVSPPPSPSSPSPSFFHLMPLPAHHLTHSLTHSLPYPADEKQKEKEKNTHKTNTSYLPNDLLTDLPTYLLYALRLHFFFFVPASFTFPT